MLSRFNRTLQHCPTNRPAIDSRPCRRTAHPSLVVVINLRATFPRSTHSSTTRNRDTERTVPCRIDVLRPSIGGVLVGLETRGLTARVGISRWSIRAHGRWNYFEHELPLTRVHLSSTLCVCDCVRLDCPDRHGPAICRSGTTSNFAHGNGVSHLMQLNKLRGTVYWGRMRAMSKHIVYSRHEAYLMMK